MSNKLISLATRAATSFASLLLAPCAMQAISISITVQRHALCDLPVGILEAEVSGGDAPYTYDWYIWQPGVGYAPQCLGCSEVIGGLQAGSYRVEVTDALQEVAVAEFELYAYNANTVLEALLGYPYLENGVTPYFSINPSGSLDLVGCEWLCVSLSNGDPVGFDGCWQWPDVSGRRFYTVATEGGTVTFSVAYDGGSCEFQLPYEMPSPATVPPTLQVLEVEGSCSNAATGSAIITVSGAVFAYASSPPGDTWPWPYRVWRNAPGYVQGPGGAWGELLIDDAIGPTTTFFTLSGLSPGTHHIFVSTAGSFSSPAHDASLGYDVYSSVLVTIPNLGPTCGELKGRVFVDGNLNCSSQINEAGVPGVVMEVLPGPLYTNTGTGGSYGLVLPNGSYTVQAQSSVVEEHCSGDPLPFTITGSPAGTTVNHPMVSLVPFDGRITQTSGAARPGFEYHVGMAVRNLTPSVSGAITVTLEFDPVLDFLSATPAPSNVSGNVLTWSQPQLTAFQSRSFTVRFQVPPNVGLLGTDLITTAMLTSVQPDANLDNNTSTLVRTITGAYDPNDKLATTSLGSGNQWLVGQDEWIDYTIRFQNTGTDTAFHVIITDTLPSNLDPATLEMGAASHPFTWELKGAGVLKFKFLGILLPDSNINEPLSHGFVGFRIRPRLPLLPGDVIENIANIYFDFNPPVITEPSVVVASTGTGVEHIGIGALSIQPNPTDGLLIVRMTGDDLRPGMLRVRSMDGRVVMEQRMTGPEVRMDVQGLANGAYVLELLNDNGPRSVARFVKQ